MTTRPQIEIVADLINAVEAAIASPGLPDEVRSRLRETIEPFAVFSTTGALSAMDLERHGFTGSQAESDVVLRDFIASAMVPTEHLDLLRDLVAKG